MEEKYRIKVIKDYPNNPFPLGKVIEVDKDTYESFYDKDSLSLSKYPSIIKVVQWWEYKTKDDISFFPNYLKHIYKNSIQEVHKVEEWLFNRDDDTVNGFKHSSTDSFPQVSLNHWLPATEEEYNIYKSEMVKNA